MRFGQFVFPVSHVPENDGAVMDNTLREIELADSLGFEATWLTEHHFDGASAYVDPTVFGAAVAVRTKQIKIGFAVVELAFHHPVLLAAQTAIIDNLSHGRLIVGTGRGSAYNHYEYIGFGLTMEQGVERLDEAEELIVKAWTQQDLKHKGKTWDIAFPQLRPMPFQKPHPPLVRACISEASTIAMAKIGRPVLIGVQEVEDVRKRVNAYQETMSSSGFSDVEVDDALNKSWFSKNLFVAESADEAMELAKPGFDRERKHFRAAREDFNPDGFPPLDPSAPLPAGEDINRACIIGTPSQVADRIAEFRDAGARNLMLKMNMGEMDTEQVQKSMKLFAEKVMPKFAD